MRKVILHLVYDIILFIFFFLGLPKFIYKSIVYGKYKKNLKHRFGIGIPKLKEGIPVIWLHGASMGEIRLLLPLIDKLTEENLNLQIVVTACTETGLETANKLFSKKDAQIFILPIDFSFFIKRVVNSIKPQLFIFSEGDYWVNLMRFVKACGSKIVVINGKVSEKSFKRFSMIKGLSKYLFSYIDHFCLQDHVQKQRFIDMGVEEKKIRVTGNIKSFQSNTHHLDTPLLRDRWRDALGINKEDFVLVLGSTHRVEDAIWIKALFELRKSCSLKIVWVPRHIERTKEIVSEISEYGFSIGLWSLKDTFSNGKDIIIIDSVGLLSELYAVGDIAFVGGTFDEKIGGHNLLEPLFCSVPLIFGPYIYSQSDLGKKIITSQAGLCITKPDLIRDEVYRLYTNEEDRNAYILRGNEFLNHEKEAFNNTWDCIKAYINLCKRT